MIQSLLLGVAAWLAVCPPEPTWTVETTADYKKVYDGERYENYNLFRLRLAGAGVACIDWGDGTVQMLWLSSLPEDSAGFGIPLSHRYRQGGGFCYSVRIVGWGGGVERFACASLSNSENGYADLRLVNCTRLRRLDCSGHRPRPWRCSTAGPIASRSWT